MFHRGDYFWFQDGNTSKQETLYTKDKATARRLLRAKNEARQQPLGSFSRNVSSTAMKSRPCSKSVE
jgi:hypothetical protein